VSIESVFQSRGLQLSPERVPKIEPLDLLEVDGDSQAPSVLSGSEEGVDNNTALFLGSVVDLKVHQDRISTADTGQNKGIKLERPWFKNLLLETSSLSIRHRLKLPNERMF